MLTQLRANELLEYRPDTGNIHWRVQRGRVNAGDIAGKPKENGYIQIRVDGRMHYAHRLAFLLMTGEFPSKDVDHINRDRADNRWLNLREATRSQNLANTKQRDRSLPKGVSFEARSKVKPYVARIFARGRNYHLGSFASISEAEQAYLAKSRELFGEFAA